MKKTIGAGFFLSLWICGICYPDSPIFREIKVVETDSPPKIDGILNDLCWQKAAQTGGFIQYGPSPGKAATQLTKVFVAHDQNRLYVGFECLKDDMNRLAANSTRRDSPFFSDDHVEVFLDTFSDKRNCYAFALNPLGTQRDRRIINEGSNVRRGGSELGSALPWDCDWDGRAAIHADKWTAEFSIPFAELRFPKSRNHPVAWGVNFWRHDESREEEQSWADVGSRQYAVSRFGHLTNLPVDSLVTKRLLEIKPYGVAKPQQLNAEAPVLKADTGLDLRYPFSNMSVDFTINPDFAQIEADPDRVNLTDIPLRFPEKRPFFLEGNEIFQMPVELFYSRRVGDLSSGAKMAGKLGEYNLAVLSAQAEPEDPDEEIEEGHLPLGEYNYSVLRVQRELGRTSSVGFLGVNKQRGGLYDRASGVDARFTLPGNVDLNLEYAREWKTGVKSDDLIFAQLSRRTNRFSFDLRYTDIGEHFDLETGFIPRINRRGLFLSTRYTKHYDGLIKRLRGGIRYERLENHAGFRTNEQRSINGSIRIQDFFLWLGPQWYFHVTDERIAYTDKLVRFYAGWSPPKWASIRNFGSVGIRDGKDTFFIRPEITLRPTSKLSFEIILQRLIEDRELTEWTRRFTVNYQFAQRMYARTTSELTIENERRIFLLFAYEYRPESIFFIVYNDNRDEEGATERLLFVKISHLFKLGVW
ncbi:MAG: DUF5916 domain-containing protein [Candidatus Poribacteria bacterium]|nr:DUF5916 domain-containing protein [Candidatus Poribacteria bacterium]